MYCKRCSTLFKSYGGSICPVCLTKYDEIMEKIKAYAEENPNANVLEISKAIGEKETDILYLIKTKRLSIKTENASIICNRCGVKIQDGSGRYCKKCSDEILNQLNEAKRTMKKDDVSSNNKDKLKGKMYTIYRHME